MNQCHYCDRWFRGPQSVKAHLRHCKPYLNSQDGTPRVASPSTPSQAPEGATVQSPPESHPLPTPSDIVAHLVTQMTAQFAGPDEATRLRQKRESLLTLLLSNLIDWHRSLEGVVTPEMAAAAKIAILDELHTQSIEDLSQAELTLRGEVIRNRVFAPFLRKQQEELTKQHEVKQREQLRAQQQTDTQARRIIRKTALIELGISRALQSASSRAFPARVLVVLEWEIRARLDAWLVGDEVESQVEEAIEAAITRPLLEWKARMEQFQTAERQRVLEKCLTAAVPVVEGAVPWVQEVVVKYICDMLGMPSAFPSSASEPTASSMNEPSPDRPEGPTPRRVRRRRVRPYSAPLDGQEAIAPDELAPLRSMESRTGTN